MSPVEASKQVPNTYLRQFFRFLGSRESLLEGTSETPSTLARLDGSNSFRDYCQFFRNARDQMSRPDIGLALGRVNQLANMHGPVSTVAFQSTDIRDCLELMKRFTPLRLTILKTSLVEEPDAIGLEIEIRGDAGDIHVPVKETLLLSLAGIIAAVSQGNVRPSSIELDYPAPPHANLYREAFNAVAILFDRPALRIMVSRRDAGFVTGTDTDPELRAAAIRRCEELLRGVLETHSTRDRIRQMFADNPGHLWTVQDIARHMNTSPRTLQRRLAAENTSYQQLQQEWLEEETRQLLGEKNLSIESIALLLGYSEVSNFRFACRRWFGMSPNDYRQTLERAFN